MLQYGRFERLGDVPQSTDVLIRRNPAPTAWIGYGVLGPRPDLDGLDPVLEVTVDLAGAEFLGGVDARRSPARADWRAAPRRPGRTACRSR